MLKNEPNQRPGRRRMRATGAHPGSIDAGQWIAPPVAFGDDADSATRTGLFRKTRFSMRADRDTTG